MRRLLSTLVFLWASALSFAGAPVKWTFGVETTTEGLAMVTLTAECEEGWHLYALTLPRDDGPFPTVIRLTPSATYEQAGAIVEPTPFELEDPNFQMLVRYHEHSTIFRIPVKRLVKKGLFRKLFSRHSKKIIDIDGEVEYMCCNDKMCLPPVTVKFSVPLPAAK